MIHALSWLIQCLQYLPIRAEANNLLSADTGFIDTWAADAAADAKFDLGRVGRAPAFVAPGPFGAGWPGAQTANSAGRSVAGAGGVARHNRVFCAANLAR